jgi:hypothetical protein
MEKGSEKMKQCSIKGLGNSLPPSMVAESLSLLLCPLEMKFCYFVCERRSEYLRGAR